MHQIKCLQFLSPLLPQLILRNTTKTSLSSTECVPLLVNCFKPPSTGKASNCLVNITVQNIKKKKTKKRKTIQTKKTKINKKKTVLEEKFLERMRFKIAMAPTTLLHLLCSKVQY